MNVYKNLVYTIIDSHRVDEMIKNGVCEFTEGRAWTGASKFLSDAKKKNEILHLIIAPSERGIRNTGDLYAYAEISSIEIHGSETTIKATNLKKFVNDKIDKTELCKTNGQFIDPAYQRGYSLCQTDSILHYIEKEPAIPILDLSTEEFRKIICKPNFFSETEIEALRYIAEQKDFIFDIKKLSKFLADSKDVWLILDNLGKKFANFYSLDFEEIGCDYFRYSYIFIDWIETDEPHYYEYGKLRESFANALFESGILKSETKQQTYKEGKKVEVEQNRYERNPQARQDCINFYGKACMVCGFDFEKIYGEIGKGFIHVHHIKEISSIGKEYVVDPIKDLRPVCPNCHAMLHQKKPAFTIEELKEILNRS